MAEIKITRLVCDADHAEETEAAESVRFAVGTQSYAIDLCAEHLGQFEQAILPWQARARNAGRIAGGSGGARRSSGSSSGGSGDNKALRLFGRSEGFDVKTKGRIHPDVTAKWEQLSEGQREQWRAKAATD
jgi:hypothetical protein